MGTQQVIDGTIDWHCQQSDAIAFLKSLPDDSIDLIFTSPPYENCRTYGIDFAMKGEDWVKWMVDLVTVASPKVKGLIAINCEGKTEGFRYSCVPFLLMADLTRSGLNLRKPPIYRRVGIPGSGGPDWLRNDWEPVICVTRPGKLRWSDCTSMGHPPKYDIGGRMSHRTRTGERIDGRSGVRGKGKEIGTIERKNGSVYQQPDLANPGNVIECTVGGGQMGHPIAHRNEAPFPLELPKFFVKSFCPPKGIVCDPFSGSGTVAHAAIENGRRFVGCDIRQSQVDLTARRIRTVTKDIFAGVG